MSILAKCPNCHRYTGIKKDFYSTERVCTECAAVFEVTGFTSKLKEAPRQPRTILSPKRTDSGTNHNVFNSINYHDLRYNRDLGTPEPELTETTVPDPAPVGCVYLLKAGPFYKIGKATNFERRLNQIKLQLPYPVEVIHKIFTHDISGMETYWHRRFRSKRTNGEWFLLTDEDVAEFKQTR